MESNEIKTIDGYWHIPENYRKISWDEYDKTINLLCSKIENYLKDYNKKIDVIVPILRGGLVPANYLAYKLKLLRIVPIQYKYLVDGDGDYLKQILPFNPYNLEKDSTVLLVDNNHGTGLQAEIAAEEIKKNLPQSNIIYAATYMDISHQKNKYCDEIFYGELTNTTVSLTPKECSEKQIEFKVPCSPWETLEEEAYINKEIKFNYVDENKLIKDCKTLKTF